MPSKREFNIQQRAVLPAVTNRDVTNTDCQYLLERGRLTERERHMFSGDRLDNIIGFRMTTTLTWEKVMASYITSLLIAIETPFLLL